MLNRFPLKCASGTLHTPFDFRNDANCRGHPDFSSPLRLNALQTVRIKHSVPASEDPHAPIPETVALTASLKAQLCG